MKYIKKYESLNFTIEEDLSNSAALYLEVIQPVTNEEGFIECLYDIQLNEHDDVSKVYFDFYFYTWIDEEINEKFYNFIKENNFKFIDEIHNLYNLNKFYIIVELTWNKVKEFAELYDDTNNFNL